MSKERKKRTVAWHEIEEFQNSFEDPYDLIKEENFRKFVEMNMNLDYSTIPDDVNYNDEEWLRKKAEAKAAAKLKSDGT